MDISQFDFHLPKELIAQSPSRSRSASRLLVLDRATGEITHEKFNAVLQHLKKGDALVLNNTKVFKARLWGHRVSGGKVEIFLVRRPDATVSEEWEALVSPSRRVHVGERVMFDDQLGIVVGANLAPGRRLVQFDSKSSFHRILSTFGHVPLPHYINRPDEAGDLRRYQTVFADKTKVGAVAAPTAGFHFTKSLLEEIAAKGVKIAFVTLNVGPGTFKPVKTDRIEDHLVDPEFAELSPETAQRLNSVRKSGGRVFAVGTTSVRTLESAKIVNGEIQPFSEMVNLYIRPGFKFRIVNHIITNFHLPKSSLLILVSSFAGRERILDAYRSAIENGYHFYSYGDAMLIL